MGWLIEALTFKFMFYTPHGSPWGFYLLPHQTGPNLVQRGEQRIDEYHTMWYFATTNLG